MSQTHSSVIVSPARLEALRRLELVDSSAEPAFDRLTMLAARVLKTSVVLISLVDQTRQFFKSFVGLSEPWATLRETPLSHSFCQYVVASSAPLIIDDARTHPLVQNNLAIADLNVIAYAGIPLITHEGYALGSFCAIDSTPRAWTDDEIAILEDLAAAVMTEIELRAEIIERKQAEEAARLLAEQRKRLLEVAQAVVSTLALDEILPKLQRTLQEVLEHDALSVYWVDEAAGLLIPAHTIHPAWLSDQTSTWSIPLGSGIAGLVGRSGRAELVNNAHLDSRSIYPPGTTSARPHHMICVPIQTNDRTRGVLIMSRNNGTPFTDQEFHLVQLFVSFVALAIENARLFEQTRESEKRFSTIFRASPVAYTITSLATGQFIEVNQAFVDLMGYSRDEVIGRTTTELDAWANPADRKRVVQILQQHQSVRSMELTFRTKSGTMLEVLASMEIIDLDGERCILSLTQDITNHKRAEAALAEQHSFRAAIIERAAEGLCVCHTIDVFPYVAFTVWNDRMTEITGYTIEAINTHGWYQSLYPDPDVQARAIERMDRMRYGEDLLAEEWEIARRDGAKRVVTISTSVLATADGSAHVLALIQDVTERRRAEEALRESEERFRTLIRDLQVGVLLQGPGAEIILSNRAALDLLGLTEDQLLGKRSFDPSWNVVHEDGSPFPGPDHPVPRAIATRRPVRSVIMGVFRPTTRDRAWLLVNAEPQLYDDGSIRHVICSFSDITERKRMEEALAHERDLLHTLMDNVPDTIYFKDTASRFTRINHAQGRVLKLEDPREAIGKTDLDFQATELAAQFLEEEQAIFESGQPLIDRIEFNPAPDGQPRWFSATKVPIIGRDGRPTGLVGISRDVTERMLAERDRERLIAELTDALTNIKTLRGLLPICSSCKKIRDDHGYWNQIESYIKTHSEADFTHGICPDCIERLYGDLYND
jgi:PAS domain S-box-containing protein